MEGFLKFIQVSLTPEFDKYFGTKPREMLQGVSEVFSWKKTLRGEDCIAEAEVIYEKNIEKCKDVVKYAQEDLHLSHNTTIKACEMSRSSKKEFRDALVDLCMVAKRLECALKACISKMARRRDLFSDYVKKIRIVEQSRYDLALAEESHATEVAHISEKILEERKQKLSVEAEALLAIMMS